MPQLNPEFYTSQIFWLIITFGLTYLFINKFFLPKIGTTVELRDKQIARDIKFSEDTFSQQKVLQQEALTIIETAKRNGFEIIENATKEAELKLSNKVSIIERDIGTKIAKEEERLARFKIQLETNLQSIVLDLKNEITSQILNNLQSDRVSKNN